MECGRCAAQAERRNMGEVNRTAVGLLSRLSCTISRPSYEYRKKSTTCVCAMPIFRTSMLQSNGTIPVLLKPIRYMFPFELNRAQLEALDTPDGITAKRRASTYSKWEASHHPSHGQVASFRQTHRIIGMPLAYLVAKHSSLAHRIGASSSSSSSSSRIRQCRVTSGKSLW